jgi:pimeloyl-ACP methyl ester carboxylesterase
LIPDVQYTKCGTINIAYQTIGDGPFDIVLVPGWVSNLDVFWEEPRLARFFMRLAAFSRLILFDKRGTGLSDRIPGTPTLEDRMEDVRAVMDAVGSERAALFGYSEGGPMCALFAATYPNLSSGLIMVGSYPRRFRTDDYPIGPTKEQSESFIEAIPDNWGTTFALDARAPSVKDDPRFQQWWGRYLRMSASPAAAQDLMRANLEIDIREILPSISVPTLLIHAIRDQTMDIEHSRYMQSRIPNAKLIEIEAQDHLPWLDGSEGILNAIEQFLSGSSQKLQANRMLSTLLFTDIVGSTDLLSKLGDEGWGDALHKHNDEVRRCIETFSGREIKATGDGFLAMFDGPARAVQCAKAIKQAAENLGLSLRQGVHTGECEYDGVDLSGLAVHLASRIMDTAESDQILVSRTVRDLVAGSGLKFEPAGAHTFKGIEDQWELHEVV